MKRITLLLLLLCSARVISFAQAEHSFLPRYIEVTGSAEMEIEPDEIRFVIGIKEYWEEEFSSKKPEFERYKTKVPIAAIESGLLKSLKEAGIPESDISVREIGNYWRYPGKEFLIGKQMEIVVHDFNRISALLEKVDMKGIDYMGIGELRNKDIENHRREVKIRALQAAQEKAAYMVQSMGKELGEILHIKEVDPQLPYYPGPAGIHSNVALSSPESASADQIRKIKLRYEIEARFEIK